MCGPETEVGGGHSVPKAGNHTLTSIVKWAGWEALGDTCRNWRLVRAGLTPVIHWCLGTIGSPHLLLLQRDYGLKRSCALCPRITRGSSVARTRSPDSPFVRSHTLAATSPLELYFVSYPTASLGSFPNQYAVGFSLPFS